MIFTEGLLLILPEQFDQEVAHKPPPYQRGPCLPEGPELYWYGAGRNEHNINNITLPGSLAVAVAPEPDARGASLFRW